MAQNQMVRGVKTSVITGRSNGRDTLQCWYRDTCVAERFHDGSVRLHSGGWRTATTKLRMNQFANQYCNGRFYVFQRNFEWFVIERDSLVETPFSDGMTV